MTPPLPPVDTGGLLTILGLAAAVWAVVPAATKLRFRLSITPLDWCVVIGMVGLVHYLVFEGILRSVGLYFSFGPWRWGFDKNSAVYLLLFTLAMYLLLRTRAPKLARRNLHLFEALFSSHLATRRYDDLAELMKGQLGHVLTVATTAPYRKRIADWIRPTPIFIFDRTAFSMRPKPRGKFEQTLDSGRAKLAGLIQPPLRRNVGANRMLQQLLNAPHLVHHLAVHHPYLCLEALVHPRSIRSDFSELFIEAQLNDHSSLLYHELKHNRNLSGRGHRLALPNENELLCFFFQDVTVASKFEIYRPIGEALCHRIDFDSELVEAYNGPLGYYDEAGKFKCPLYSGITLFEIMILEAAHQQLDDHLWLHYFPIFTDKILKQMRPAEPSDENHEFPSIFHFLLYKIVSICTDWVEEAQFLNGLDSKIPPSQFVSEAAANALGNIIISIVLADQGERFKSYMLEVVLSRMSKFQHIQSMETLSRQLESYLIEGCVLKTKDHYRVELYSLYQGLDYELTAKLDSFTAMLASCQPGNVTP